MTVSFSGGEISPSLHGRVDLAKYQSSLKTCRNWIVEPFGGVRNRPGTRLIAETKTEGKKVRLVPFVFSQSQTYVLEFGQGYIRFFRGSIPLPSVVNVSGAVFNLAGGGLDYQLGVPVDGGLIQGVTTIRTVSAIYAGGTKLSGEAVTNLSTPSNDFTGSAWSGAGTITANNAEAPDSTMTADTLAWSAS